MRMKAENILISKNPPSGGFWFGLLPIAECLLPAFQLLTQECFLHTIGQSLASEPVDFFSVQLMKDSKDLTRLEGVIDASLPAGAFKVKLDDDRVVRGQLSGKMRKYRIKIVPGDRVLMEFTPYDDELGRITRRL